MSARAPAGDRRPWVSGGLLAALLSLLLIHGAVGQDEPAMRSEDVVRMLVRGTGTGEILAAIRERPAEFDVSPELQQELRLAGVPDEVIEAMIERMAELAPQPEEPQAPVEAAPPKPMLRILLAPPGAERGPAPLLLEGVVDLGLRQAWQLDPSVEGTPFEDLAVFLVCRSATHVPDHWRSKSPLGRDFISMPRHRMLAFVSAGEQRDDASDTDRLALELPPSLDAALDPGEPHDLALGLAVQAGGRYFRWVDDGWDALSLAPGGTELSAEIRGGRDGRLDALEVRFVRPAAPPSGD